MRNVQICWRCARTKFLQVPRRQKSSSARQQLPSTPARTRFAPSPTGYLHIGSLRTALFNYLLAKATGGQFLLRIEDTDRSRTVPDAEARLCEDLKWAGLQWDEGPDIGGKFGPYRQSERSELHREHANVLVETGHAYRCFCPAERLQKLAEYRAKIGLPSEYDRTCLSIPKDEADDRAAKGEQHVIRLKMPDQLPPFDDVVYGRINTGRITVRHGEPSYEDPVLIKSDGMPTYHLANVVDDHFMEITHVIRATEWLPSTPKHIFMYNAFKWTPPAFVHVGLLQNTSRQKFSKRHQATDMNYWRNAGYLPEALINHVALLGWSHRERSDVMELPKLAEIFSLRLTKGNAVATEDKLDYLQHAHVKRRFAEGGQAWQEVADLMYNYAENEKPDLLMEINVSGRDPKSYIQEVLEANVNSYTIPEAFFRDFDYFFDFTHHPLDSREADLESASGEQGLEIKIGVGENLQELYPALQALSDEEWTTENIQGVISAHLSKPPPDLQLEDPEAGLKLLDLSNKGRKTHLLHAIRWAVAGDKKGPGIGLMLHILGRETVLERIGVVLEHGGFKQRPGLLHRIFGSQ